MVAMLGAIMPLPLPMAPTVQVLPPSSNWMAYSFLWVSVVMMAVAASATSGFWDLRLFTPTYTAPAVKPFGEVMPPPSITLYSIVLFSFSYSYFI